MHVFKWPLPWSSQTNIGLNKASQYAFIMVSRRNQTLLSLSIFIGVLAWNIAAADVKGKTGGVPVGQLSVHEIEEQLQVCLSFHMCCGRALGFSGQYCLSIKSKREIMGAEHRDVACSASG